MRGRMGGGRTISPTPGLSSSGSLHPKCLLTLFLEPLAKAPPPPPSPRTSLPITLPSFSLPHTPHSESPSDGDPGKETPPECPRPQLSQRLSE